MVKSKKNIKNTDSILFDIYKEIDQFPPEYSDGVFANFNIIKTPAILVMDYCMKYYSYDDLFPKGIYEIKF